MYDYFGIQMPEKVAKRANEFLWNGAANGSVTACLDYATYWPRLKYQTEGEPDVTLLGLRTFFSSGIGIQVDLRVADLRDKALLEERLESGVYDKASLQALYGLERGNNLLHGAAMLNLHRLPEMLIRKFKADVNEQNNDGDTPLLLACRHGHFPLIAKLLSNGARANIANKYGETPLHWVINVPNEPTSVNGRHIPSVLEMSIIMLSDTGDLEAKAQLYSAGGDYFTRLKWAAGTPLHRAVSRRNLAAARYLLKQGADPLAVDGSPEEDAMTPLDLAMHHHNAPMLKLLLDASQYDINTIDKYGTTLFSRAISTATVLEMITIHGKRYLEAIHDTMELLLSRGLNLKVAQVTSAVGQPTPFRKKILGSTSNYEFDGLYLAVYFEKLAWVQFMLKSAQCMSFLDINRHNGSMGMTALHQSVKDGRKSIFKALLASGADPSSRFNAFLQDVKGFENTMTCLHLVATQGDDDLFFSKRLLGYDLDIDAGDIYGTTPFALAVVESHFHVANALLEAGSDIDKLMSFRTASQGRGRTILERVLDQGANGLQRLQYLLSRERSADDAAQDKTKPWLSRPGQPASLRFRHGSTALHYFLHINRGRTDSMFVACFRTILDACGPSLLNDLARPTPRLDVDCKRVTPLHIVVENANPVAVRMLLHAGADQYVANEDGTLPLDVARQQLKQHGSSQKSRNTYREVIRILEGDLGTPAELEGPDMGERLSSRLRDLMT
ncbi:ankyrin repeat-containing domain protein [Thelonectria olida]|uniref:Ankyrin repeat-containing domain protein n=1 Tax=Thelonectria olida TaxID=1576542 RepID=A0A9P8W8U8_9HYPO|nr:ankyrin repeat-containing domain protein [Thelonectria olida]